MLWSVMNFKNGNFALRGFAIKSVMPTKRQRLSLRAPAICHRAIGAIGAKMQKRVSRAISFATRRAARLRALDRRFFAAKQSSTEKK